ncbi:MAG: sigma-70 family RNA polymerase sigma factor [Lewinellaceae bacterium]|nr:sigma-70 family RNA polymerase sigma factor [Lewinella sp.]MCB9278923.1 sigma-70 family RNA polymerase sigma factor [Lewinellaceae bacterium]
MNVSRRTVSKETMQEEWLEIQAAQKEPARFRPLYNRYYEPIFRYLYQRTIDEDLTADLCSQVFLKAMQRLGEYTFMGVPFSAWLYRIAANELAQHYRAAQKKRVVGIDDANLSDMIEEMEEESPEWMRNLLVQALDGLKGHELDLIEMRFFEQRSFREIAELLDMTENNAKVKTYRILERLKKKLSLQIKSKS